jgi:hypothetical protein
MAIPHRIKILRILANDFMSASSTRLAAFRAETDRLERIVKTREHVLANLDALHRVSAEEARIFIANQEAIPYLRILIGEWPHRTGYNWTASVTLLDAYAQHGDPLAAATRDYIQGLRYRKRDRLLSVLDLPERMLKRTLTEAEYEGMLHGTSPLAVNGRREFYLRTGWLQKFFRWFRTL